LINFARGRTILYGTLFAVAMLSIGSASILVRLSSASGVACAFWRLALSSLLMLLLNLVFSRSTSELFNVFTDKSRLFTALVAGLSLALHFVLWMESLFRVPIAISVTIVVAYPLHLAFVEIVRERNLHALSVLPGLVLGFIGIVMFFRDAFMFSYIDSVGVMQSFAASVLAAIYFYASKMLRRNTDLAVYAFSVYSIASLAVLTYAFAVGDNVFGYLPGSWLWFLLLAIIPMLGGHTVMNYLLKFYRSSSVTSIALAEPVIATILASILLGETVEPRHLLPLSMVLTGVAFVVVRELKS